MTLHLKESIKRFWNSKVEDMTSYAPSISILKRNHLDTVEQVYNRMNEGKGLIELRGMGTKGLMKINSAFLEYYLSFLSEEEVTQFFEQALNGSEAIDVLTKGVRCMADE